MVKPRLFAGRFSRVEKARQRQRIELEDAALTEQTQVRYYNALRKLLPYVEKCTKEEDLDLWVSHWIKRMWKSGEPLLTIGDGLSALHYFQPSTKRKIPHSWRLFATWRKIEIPMRAPPLTLRIIRSLAAYEMEHGNLDMCTLLLLGFHCMLRTGELLGVCGNDFVLGSKQGICSLKYTKTGKRNAANEFITIDDIITLEALAQLIRFQRETNTLHCPLWNRSPGLFRKRFQQLCEIFKLQHFQFRPYSMRRGGATHYFQISQSMEGTLIRGRWESSRVARIYISDALSWLPSLKMSQATASLLQKFYFLNPQEG